MDTEQIETPVYATADDLSTSTIQEEDVKLPSGRWVRIRQLSRAHLFLIQQAVGDPKKVLRLEQEYISASLVMPAMTLDQVAAWHRADAAGGDIGALMDEIRTYSGLAEGSAKAAYKSA